MKNLKTIVMLLMVLAVGLNAEAKKVKLQYQLEQGKTFTYEVKSNQDITQEMMGQTMGQTIESVQTFEFAVKEVLGNGDYVMEYRMKHYRMEAKTDMGDMSFDTETANTEGAMGELMNKLLMTPIEFVMKGSGEIVEFKNNEEIAALVDSLADPTNPEFQMLAPIMSHFGSDDASKQSISTMLLVYPGGKIKSGKTWESTSTMNQMVNFVSTNVTQLSEIKGNTAILTQDNKISVGEGGTTMEQQGMEMEFELAGGKQGSFEVDMTTGLIQKASGITTITGIISIDSSQLPAPMSIPMTIKTNDEITLIN